MSIRLHEPLDEINAALNSEGRAMFYIIGGKQTLAQVIIEGGHEVTMTARIMGKRAVKGVGTATIYRQSGQDITEFVLASAFGTAYARAVDPKPAPQPQTRRIDGTIDIGDFVHFSYGGLPLSGVVVDVLASRSLRRSGYVVNTGVEELIVSVDHTVLVAKGV